MPVELPDLTPPQAIRNASGLPRRVGEKPYDQAGLCELRVAGPSLCGVAWVDKLNWMRPSPGMSSPPRSSADLEALIARCGLGDRKALDELYKASSAKLFGICLRVLNDRAAAEDVLQEVFVKVWHAADRYASNGLSPISWMATIARNAAIDRLRQRTARREDGGDAIPEMRDRSPTPEQRAVAAGEARRIAGCMEELEAVRRDAVRGAYLDGRTYAELATAAGVPLNTMRTWLRRSLIALRECLAR